MTWQTAEAGVRLLASLPDKTAGIAFFGGEPLLERDLVEHTVRFALAEAPDKRWSFNMTTNGLLLDETFLHFANENGLRVALSHDGAAHDEMRVDGQGRGTAGALEKKIDLLLSHQPRAVAMCTVCVKTLPRLYESLRWLFERGFQRVNCAYDCRPEAGWEEAHFEEFARQYGLLQDYLFQQALQGKHLDFIPFTAKIRTHLCKPRDLCRLGKKQPSVAPDGKLYPCIQFVDAADYAIGDVYAGINRERREEIYLQSLQLAEECADCAYKERCRHCCACVNFQYSGSLREVSPVQCAHERVLIPAADRLGERLWEKGLLKI